ncbi:DUF2325 domain-containing protein [Paenibacillus alkalitolerans]|uniref:DUF2325 domain-containing protein n=1 Tax=Paenibacillus alkalitolerans TaxID=2799335 RepID=UPI0018F33A06|nr:DUF2325 domain-containing protein [Paenibacillus alkalitolerans]
MKQLLFTMIQGELKKIAAHITPDNIESQLTAMEQYMDILRIVSAIPPYDIGESTAKISSLSFDAAETRAEPPASSESDNETPESKPAAEPAAYTFERKLVGGRLPELDDGYHVNERIVRKLGIQHGDKLAVEGTEHFSDGGKHYIFKIAEKGAGKEPPNRIQLNYCIAEWDAEHHKFVIRRSAIGGMIKLGDEPLSLHLNEQDCEGMEDGELIDIAFYEERLDTVRVIWKHKTKNENQSQETANHKPKQRAAEETEEDEKKFPIDYSLLEGKTITLIGAEAFRLRYQQAFHEVGMTLYHITGDENKRRMEKYIRSSDVVVAVVPYVGHNGSAPGNELCKTHNVPFVASKRSGAQQILLEIEQVFKRRLSQAQ